MKPTKMKHIILIITLILLQVSANAQALFSPSGNASATVRHINTPVNLYTGVPAISVPLYTLPGRSGSVPVALSYHASGIKVDDMPSEVGMGWSLVAGGAVTRVVRDLPDEDTPNGYLSGSNTGSLINSPAFLTAFNGTDGSTYWTQYTNYADDDDYDTEPDAFYFSFPGGSGKFHLDQNGNPYVVPFQDIKIEPAIGPQSVGKWIITTTNGTKYFFGETSASQETTTTEIYTKNSGLDRYDPSDPNTHTGYGTPTTKAHITSWHLDRIEDHNGRELFNFSYLAQTEIANSISSETTVNILPSAGAAPSSVTRNHTLTTNKHIPKNIGTITSPDLGSVSFTYGSNNRLTSVAVYHDTTLRMKYDLEYITQGGGTAYTEDDRYFLDRIIQRSTGAEADIIFRDFDYYMTETLPYRGHPAIDHWGYYNASIADTRVASYIYDPNNIAREYGNANTDKSPNLARTKAGILERVNLPTGGYEHYTYELNETFEGSRGGLRVQSIRTHDGISSANDIVTNYSYKTSGGVATSRGEVVPIYHSTEALDRVVSVSGQSLTALTDLGGVHVGYEVVEESRAGAGKTVYRYQGFHGLPDIEPSFKVVENQVSLTSYEKTASNLYDVSLKTSRSWQRGLLKSRSVFDEDGNILRITTNNYTTIDVGNSPLYGLTARSTVNNTETFYDMVLYEIKSEGYVLESRESVIYDQKGNGLGLTTKSEFTYDTNHLSLDESKTTDSNGDILISRTKYLKDYTLTASATGAAAAMKTLQDRDMNIPIEQVQYLQKSGETELKATGAGLTTFSVNASKVYPYQTFAVETSAPISGFSNSTITSNNLVYDSNYGDAVVTFNSYDAFGNLLSQTGSSGITTTYVYGADNVLLESVTVNAGTPTAKTTSYEHLPLIGVTKETDPNGRSVTYRYDGFNRLRLVIDHEGNVVSKYEYEIVNTQP